MSESIAIGIIEELKIQKHENGFFGFLKNKICKREEKFNIIGIEIPLLENETFSNLETFAIPFIEKLQEVKKEGRSCGYELENGNLKIIRISGKPYDIKARKVG